MMFEGKLVLITGGLRGIGKETALTFAKERADIVIFDIGKDYIQTIEEVKSKGVDCRYYEVDVSDTKQVEYTVDEIIKEKGKIDILVNNAGITRDNLLIRMKEEEWDMVLKVNLKGVYNCTKSVVKYMLKRKSGVIINIASIIGIMGNIGQCNYAASKAGVIAFTKSCAKEFASRGIRVNAVAPGFIKTAMTEKLSEKVVEKMKEMIPLGRLGEPKDVAECVKFLASESSGYITGQVIQVDGGMVM